MEVSLPNFKRHARLNDGQTPYSKNSHFRRFKRQFRNYRLVLTQARYFQISIASLSHLRLGQLGERRSFRYRLAIQQPQRRRRWSRVASREPESLLPCGTAASYPFQARLADREKAALFAEIIYSRRNREKATRRRKTQELFLS